jgi:hypothetical protein
LYHGVGRFGRLHRQESGWFGGRKLRSAEQRFAFASASSSAMVRMSRRIKGCGCTRTGRDRKVVKGMSPQQVHPSRRTFPHGGPTHGDVG